MDYENANKALDKARAKNKDVLQAETTQQICCQKFEKISESAKQGIWVVLKSGALKKIICIFSIACFTLLEINKTGTRLFIYKNYFST